MSRAKQERRQSPKHPVGASRGDRIKAARSKAGLTQRALGVLIGRTRSSISEYERGIASPSIGDVERMGRAMEVSPAWLAFGERSGMGKPQSAENSALREALATFVEQISSEPLIRLAESLLDIWDKIETLLEHLQPSRLPHVTLAK